MTYTIIFILITAATTYFAFNNSNLYYNLILWPKRMADPKEYYRLLTSGFIHADWNHVIFNMLTLYFFGRNIEIVLASLGNPFLYVILYLSAIVAASLPSFLKNRHNNHYMSLGASGGVSAIVFASVYFFPWEIIRVFFIPVPGILYGVFYVGYSFYMSKKGVDNVNHDAHLWGAIYGMLFIMVIEPSHGLRFLFQLTHPTFAY